MPRALSHERWHLWNQSHRLSPPQQITLERRLGAAARRLGTPIFVVLVDRLRHETAAAFAARTFVERSIAEVGAGSNPVLLVVAVDDRAAAIETGMGNAGVVPEIDAAQITKVLAAHLSVGAIEEHLARAIDAIVESAEATAARRRPLPPEDPSPSDATDGALGANPRTDAGASDGADGGFANPPGGPAHEDKPRRSRVPIGAAIAVLVLVALAIRRRRNLASTRETRDAPPRPPGAPRPPRGKF